MKKPKTALVIAIAFMALASAVLAATGQRTIQVTFRNIGLMLDGQRVATKSEPFIFNGEVYLPLAAVADAIGKPMSWDGQANVVHIGQKPAGMISLSSKQGLPPYQVTASSYGWSLNNEHVPSNKLTGKKMQLGGQIYNDGIMVQLDNTGQGTNQQGNLDWNLNGRATTIVGAIGFDDNQKAKGAGHLVFYLDESPTNAIEFKSGDLPKEFSLDVTGVLRLRAEIKGTGSYYSFTVDLVNLKAHTPGGTKSYEGTREVEQASTQSPSYTAPSTASRVNRTPDLSGFLLPQSLERPLNNNDLRGLSAKQLTLARNEIYAYHGRIFQDNELRNHFASKPWYRGNARYSDNFLTATQRANAEFIMKYQKQMGLTW